jgi:hypothetical protein
MAKGQQQTGSKAQQNGNGHQKKEEQQKQKMMAKKLKEEEEEEESEDDEDDQEEMQALTRKGKNTADPEDEEQDDEDEEDEDFEGSEIYDVLEHIAFGPQICIRVEKEVVVRGVNIGERLFPLHLSSVCLGPDAQEGDRGCLAKWFLPLFAEIRPRTCH